MTFDYKMETSYTISPSLNYKKSEPNILSLKDELNKDIYIIQNNNINTLSINNNIDSHNSTTSMNIERINKQIENNIINQLNSESISVDNIKYLLTEDKNKNQANIMKESLASKLNNQDSLNIYNPITKSTLRHRNDSIIYSKFFDQKQNRTKKVNLDDLLTQTSHIKITEDKYDIIRKIEFKKALNKSKVNTRRALKTSPSHRSYNSNYSYKSIASRKGKNRNNSNESISKNDKRRSNSKEFLYECNLNMILDYYTSKTNFNKNKENNKNNVSKLNSLSDIINDNYNKSKNINNLSKEASKRNLKYNSLNNNMIQTENNIEHITNRLNKIILKSQKNSHSNKKDKRKERNILTEFPDSKSNSNNNINNNNTNLNHLSSTSNLNRNTNSDLSSKQELPNLLSHFRESEEGFYISPTLRVVKRQQNSCYNITHLKNNNSSNGNSNASKFKKTLKNTNESNLVEYAKQKPEFSTVHIGDKEFTVKNYLYTPKEKEILEGNKLIKLPLLPKSYNVKVGRQFPNVAESLSNHTSNINSLNLNALNSNFLAENSNNLNSHNRMNDIKNKLEIIKEKHEIDKTISINNYNINNINNQKLIKSKVPRQSLIQLQANNSKRGSKYEPFKNIILNEEDGTITLKNTENNEQNSKTSSPNTNENTINTTDRINSKYQEQKQRDMRAIKKILKKIEPSKFKKKEEEKLNKNIVKEFQNLNQISNSIITIFNNARNDVIRECDAHKKICLSSKRTEQNLLNLIQHNINNTDNDYAKIDQIDYTKFGIDPIEVMKNSTIEKPIVDVSKLTGKIMNKRRENKDSDICFSIDDSDKNNLLETSSDKKISDAAYSSKFIMQVKGSVGNSGVGKNGSLFQSKANLLTNYVNYENDNDLKPENMFYNFKTNDRINNYMETKKKIKGD